MEKQHLLEWKEKGLQRQFLRETESTSDGNRWQCLKRGELKRETESLLCETQEQALRDNTIKYSIVTTCDTATCRFCNVKKEKYNTHCKCLLNFG